MCSPADQSKSAIRPVRSGFTLIELLVVVGIIAVLIGILVPVLSAAKGRGQLALCETNLHQVGVAMRSYLDGNNDVFPYASFMPSVDPEPIDSGPAIYLADVLAPHLAGDTKAFHCPKDIGAIDRKAPNHFKTYYETEKSSYDYRFHLGGSSIKEAVERFADFMGSHINENTMWIMCDYDNFHAEAGKQGARRYLYYDGHVTDYEN